MNIVSENHADNLGRRSGSSYEALISAVVCEGLRKNLAQDDDELPLPLAALLRRMDSVQDAPDSAI